MKEHLRRVAWISFSIRASEWVGNIIHLAIKAVLVHKEVCKLFIVSSCLMSDHMYSKQSWSAGQLYFYSAITHIMWGSAIVQVVSIILIDMSENNIRCGGMDPFTIVLFSIHVFMPHPTFKSWVGTTRLVKETFSTIQNRLWAIIKSKNVLCIEGEKPFWFVRD